MLKIRGAISKRSYTTLSVFTFGIVFFAWLFLSNFGLVNAVFLPSPMKVLGYFLGAMQDGSLLPNILISCQRILFGVFFAVVLGMPLGILCGTFKGAEAIIRPLCEFVRYLPVPAFVPLVMV